MRKTYLYMTAVAMSAALAAGCQKAEPAETTAAAETVAESTGTGMAESESSETSGTAAQDDERLADYHLLQGIVTGTNDEKGTFTLKADDGGEYVITTGNIGDVETEIADESLVVIGYIGVEIHDNMDLEKVNMVIAAPGDDDWTIAYAEGTTTANAMSTFMMVTADGTEMGFMKDGCPMDEDALGGDSGAKIGVVYMDSEDVSFPLEIKKLQ